MAKNANAAPTNYTKLGPRELRKFDERARAIITEAQDLGWTFRVSNRGHAIGRAPYGHATFSVADTIDSKYGGSRIARRELERWKKEHETKQTYQAKLKSGLTKQVASLARELIVEYADKTAQQVPGPVKTVLERMADNDEVAFYLADRIAEGRATPLILTYDLDAHSTDITEESKPWRIQWVMADPDDHRVIGFGGPKMTPELAAGAVEAYLAAEAKTKALAKQAALDAATPARRTLPPAPPTRKKDPAVKMYACPEPGCDAVFERIQSLGSHKSQKHAPKKQCPWCKEMFARGGLALHTPSCKDNPASLETFVCGRCEGEYKNSGKARHESTCRRMNPEQTAAKRASNRLKRGLPLPEDAPVGMRNLAKSRDRAIQSIARTNAAAPEVNVLTGAPATPALEQTVIAAPTELSRLAAALPQIADPLSALMNLLAEVEELRSARPEDLRRQIEQLTIERDEAAKRAEEAEGKLATLKSVFG
jgi:hypothetical protein